VNVLRVTRTAAALSAVLLAIAPAAAGAQSPELCVPNQSVAVLDQYCDALVTPGGSSEPIGSKAHGRPLSKVLPAREVKKLEEAGRAGMALLTLRVSPAAAGVPDAASTRVRRRLAAARGAVQPQTLEPSAADVVGISSGVVAGTGDVLGGAFRWGLVICTLGLAGMTWLRFRARISL
jgi:hypothetical protein